MMIGVGVNIVQGRGGEKPFTPAIVPNMVLWLDATNGTLDSSGNSVVVDGQSVQRWNDLSATSAHAVQTDAAKQPVLRTGANGLNGKPVLEFTSASSQYFVTPNISLRGLTLFLVLSTPQQNSTPFMMGQTGNGQYGAIFSRISDDGQGTQLMIIVRKGAVQSYRTYNPFFGVGAPTPVNGYSIFAYRNDGTNYKPTDPPYLGPWFGAALFTRGRFTSQRSEVNGGVGLAQYFVPATIGAATGGGGAVSSKIAEVIVYDQMLSQTDHQKVEDYLSAKWGIPLAR